MAEPAKTAEAKKPAAAPTQASPPAEANGQPARPKRTAAPELRAMARIDVIMQELEEAQGKEACTRVINWMTDKWAGKFVPSDPDERGQNW